MSHTPLNPSHSTPATQREPPHLSPPTQNSDSTCNTTLAKNSGFLYDAVEFPTLTRGPALNSPNTHNACLTQPSKSAVSAALRSQRLTEYIQTQATRAQKQQECHIHLSGELDPEQLIMATCIGRTERERTLDAFASALLWADSRSGTMDVVMKGVIDFVCAARDASDEHKMAVAKWVLAARHGCDAGPTVPFDLAYRFREQVLLYKAQLPSTKPYSWMSTSQFLWGYKTPESARHCGGQTNKTVFISDALRLICPNEIDEVKQALDTLNTLAGDEERVLVLRRRASPWGDVLCEDDQAKTVAEVIKEYVQSDAYPNIRVVCDLLITRYFNLASILNNLRSSGIKYCEIEGYVQPLTPYLEQLQRRYKVELHFLCGMPSETLCKPTSRLKLSTALTGITHGLYISGVDFRGREGTFTKGGMQYLTEVYQELSALAEQRQQANPKAPPLILRIHAGEGYYRDCTHAPAPRENAENNMAMLVDTLFALTNFNPNRVHIRIGHGIHGSKYFAQLLQNKFAIDMCPESNLQSGATKSVDATLLYLLFLNFCFNKKHSGLDLLGNDGAGVSGSTNTKILSHVQRALTRFAEGGLTLHINKHSAGRAEITQHVAPEFHLLLCTRTGEQLSADLKINHLKHRTVRDFIDYTYGSEPLARPSSHPPSA